MKLGKRLLIILFLPLVIFTLISCSTTKRLDQMREEHRSVESFMDDLGVAAHGSTLPVYHNTGADWNVRSLELIEQAQDYILVSTFLGVEHETTEPVWRALAQKAAEGVRVYVMIDSSSNFQMVPMTDIRIKAAFMHLRELGLNVVEYNSLTMSNLFFLANLLDRDHRKYWVIDGEVLAVGGVNVNQTSIAWPAGVGNIDTMAELYAPGATRTVVDAFVDTWNRYNPNRLDSADFSVRQGEISQSEETSVWVLDHNWPSHAKMSSLFDLFSVYPEDELWLIQGYTFLTPSLLDRIRYAVDRGVEVHIVLSAFSTQPKYEMASRYGVLDLLDAGANVYMYESPDEAFLHMKLMVADNRLVTIGSANYNLRSQAFSRELNIVYEDERVATYSMDYIRTLLEYCRPVTREEARSYRNFRSWYNFILMQVWG